MQGTRANDHGDEEQSVGEQPIDWVPTTARLQTVDEGRCPDARVPEPIKIVDGQAWSPGISKPASER